MAAIGIKIDLSKIDKKHLYKSNETGAIYLDLIAFEIAKDKQKYNSHLVVQSFPKDVREQQKKDDFDPPILGSLKMLTGEDNNTREMNQAEIDDLPF